MSRLQPTPAVSEAVAQDFPMRDWSLRDIARRAAMVRGLSVQEAALVFYRAGEQERAVLDVLGVEP